ncbi:MAG: adenosylcobinamide amidohydrolase [Methanomicrobiaceae archaeon]|nr:adenosylcobinamide amidohydrolase [Methanomicrobiaceae archaeon]
MRYFIRESTLFLRGPMKAASTGIHGGIRPVSTIFNQTVPKHFDHRDPIRHLTAVADRYGFSHDFFGMLTAVNMSSLCIFHYDSLTTFVTAGVTNPNPEGPNTINIIVHSRQGLSDGAMLETIITATEAKAKALFEMGYAFTGTTTDAVVVAHEGEGEAHEYAGTLTDVGRRVYASVQFGVQQALLRHEGETPRSEPSLFIYSRYGGDRWVEWCPRDCPYYPCHFEGQWCDFCYCPFYPCGDEELGGWVASASGGVVWSCQHCDFIHLPRVAEYLKTYPEASLEELKALQKKTG